MANNGERQLALGEAVASYDRVKPDTLGLAKRITYAESNSLLTPTSGFMRCYKFTLNPYSGCGFGCEYCYARFFAPTEQQRDTWGQWVNVKENAAELIWKAFKSRSEKSGIQDGDAIYLSSVTDPYQPIEQQLQLTRRVLEAMLDASETFGKQIRLTVQTRSPIVTRDIDLLQRFPRIRVNFTVPTDSEEVRLRYEPHCPAIEVRLRAAQEVSNAGIPIGISVSPLLPVRDPETFGERIARLNAAEYVTQYFKDPRNRFAAGTTVEALRKTKEDRWGQREYEHVRTVIQRHLGETKLLEGAEGYAPA